MLKKQSKSIQNLNIKPASLEQSPKQKLYNKQRVMFHLSLLLMNPKQMQLIVIATSRYMANTVKETNPS